MEHCGRCGIEPPRPGQRWCKGCHAAYMREHRPRHSQLAEQARLKANSRSYANTYERRGRLQRQPCADCGSPNSQKHHEDYEKPLDVVWLCRRCHLRRHKG